MGASIESLIRGRVSRALPQPDVDGTRDGEPIRIGRYNELFALPLVRKQHLLADEGTYFVANNSGTGVATGATPTSFSDTAPLLTISNTDSPGNSKAKRIYLDFARFTETAAGTAGVSFRVQVKLDAQDRYASGGTSLTPLSPNMDVERGSSVAQVRMLPTNSAVGGQARTVVGDVVAIPTQSAVIAALSSVYLNFGGVEGVLTAGPLGAAQVILASVPLPPVVIGPGQTAIINFLIGSQSAASSWHPELGWWER